MLKRIRITAILLCLFILTTLAAACGSVSEPSGVQPTGLGTEKGPSNADFQESGMPIVNEKVVQKMAFVADPVYATELGPDMYFFKEMEKRTNVNFEFEKLSPDQWTERRNLMFAANELPDLFIGSMTNGDIVTYSKAGQLMALNNLIDKHMPDYLKSLEGFPEKAKLYAPDGQMYGLSATFTGGSAETPGARAFINKKWIESLGLSMPETYQEFYDVLVAFRDMDPDGNGKDDTIPLSGYGSGYTVDPFVAGPLGISFKGAKDMWQVVDGKMVFVVSHPQYRTYLENMRQLFSEKLLDQEYYTQNDAQMKAKGEQLLLGAFTYAAHFVLTGSTDPAIYDQYAVPQPLTSDVFTKKVWYGQAVPSPRIFLTSANKNPEVTLRYFNEIFTEEGAELMVGPVEGEWDGEGGRVWNKDKTQYTYSIPQGYNGIWDWTCKVIAPVQSFQGFMQFSRIKAQEQKSPEDASFKDAMAANVAPFLDPGAPSLFFTLEETEAIKLIEDSVNTYTKQMEAKIIMGEETLDAYETMLEQLKTMGIDKMEEVYNTAYQRYLSN